MHNLKIVAVVFATLITSQSFAQNNEIEVTVFDVRKPIALSNEVKVNKDYYINAGFEKGIKRGMLITVTRSQALYDAYQNKSPGNLVVPIGKLKIIHVQKGVSVGRLQTLFSRDRLPIIDYDYIMVGDRVDLSSLEWEKKKSASRKPKNVESTDFASKKDPGKDVILPSLQ